MGNNSRDYLLLDRRANELIQKFEGMSRDWWATRDLANDLNTSISFVEKGRSQGYGPKFVRLGPRCIRYYKDEVIAWLIERTHQNTAEYEKPTKKRRAEA